MKIAIDALGASTGGMQLYARELVAAWTESHPEDALLLVGYDWLEELRAPNVLVAVLPGGLVPRALGQWVGSGLLARFWGADALLSVSPVVSPLFPPMARFCVVHDWRHLTRAEEFGSAQRLYRRGWGWSVAHAAVAFQVSNKTDRETRTHLPRATTMVVSEGRDHARRWAVDIPARPEPHILTFGHFVNKRAGLVIEAMASVVSRHPDLRLVVLGARGDEAERLRAVARRFGIEGAVNLPGYVEDLEHRSLTASAAAVVLASSDEGFGLPVCEANFLGVPCVVTSDSGLEEIHEGRVLVADPSAESLAVVIEAALVASRRTWREQQESWATHAEMVRSAIQTCVERGGAG